MCTIEKALVGVKSLFVEEEGPVREIVLKIEKNPSTFYQRDTITLEIHYEKKEDHTEEDWPSCSCSGSKQSLIPKETVAGEPETAASESI